MNKKIISFMLASAMVAGMPLSVSASAVTVPTGSVDVKTEGDVGYVNTDVFAVTLPTANCFNFTVDPQGILSALDSTNYGEALYPDGTAGYIVPTEAKGAYINNKSSVPIKLTVDAYVEKDDTTGDPSSVNLLSTDQYGIINSGIDNNMWLTLDITDEMEDPKTFIDESSITTQTVVPNVIAITKNGAPAASETGTQISFALDKAAYEFKGTGIADATYDMVTGEAGDSVGLRLSGMVNTNADWSVYTGASAEKIIVKTVFDFEKLSTDYEQSALDGRAHGVLADVDPQYYAGVEYDADGNPTDPIKDAYEYAVGQGAIEIPFDFGTGTKEVTVDDISVNGNSLAAADYKVNNYVITIKITEANVKAELDAAVAGGTTVPVEVTTSDGKTTAIDMIVYGLN